MAKKRITSKPGMFGYIYHYDEKGKRIGKSRSGLIGDTNVHYDAKGKRIGNSRPGYLAKEVYHDEENERYISSYEGLMEDVYFDTGTPAGVSRPGFGGTVHTTLNADDESNEVRFYEDTFWEEDETQEFLECNARNKKTIVTNIIVFAACCLIVGILVLIFR